MYNKLFLEVCFFMSDLSEQIKTVTEKGISACTDNLGVTITGIGIGVVLAGFSGATIGTCLLFGVGITAVGCWITSNNQKEEKKEE